MISKQIALYLQSQSLGTVGTDLFYGYLPASPNTLTTIYDTGGDTPDARLGYDYPSIQIRTRAAAGNSSIETAYTMMTTIYNVLQGLHSIVFTDGTPLVDCLAVQSSPTAIDLDDMQRAEFTMDFNLHIRNKTNNRE